MSATKGVKARKIILIVLISILALFALVFFIPFFVMLAGERSDVNGQPKVMVIFGYQLDGDEMPSLLKSRLATALSYLEEHDDVVVIVSGGKGDGEHMSEAQCMRDYLVEHGVDDGRIYVEDRSSTTVENIRFSLDLIKQNGLDAKDGVLLVSNEFHLARIRMLFKRAKSGFAMSTLAAPSIPSSQKALMRLREPFAMLFDFLTAKF